MANLSQFQQQKILPIMSEGSCVKVVNALVRVDSHGGSTAYNGSDSGQISKQIGESPWISFRL
jgi:hypothetical protein